MRCLEWFPCSLKELWGEVKQSWLAGGGQGVMWSLCVAACKSLGKREGRSRSTDPPTAAVKRVNYVSPVVVMTVGNLLFLLAPGLQTQ